jgi:hypothetical protein
MIQIILGVVAGFFAWIIVWFSGEKILSILWPAGFGVHQRAFTDALTNGGQFTPTTTFLAIHCVLCAIVSLLAGYVTALIAGEKMIAPIAIAVVMLALGILKAVMSWKLVPAWYHVTFAVLLFSMAYLGGTL